MTSDLSKLMVLRGPSRAGKSTVARELAASSPRPTAIVERDHYMLMFNAAVESVPDKELIGLVIRHLLERGIDVILEGNVKPDTHLLLLEQLLAAHPNENFFFYLDVSLGETLRRHATRRQIITAEKMTELYPVAIPLGRVDEVLIPESSSVSDAVRSIMAAANLHRA